MTPRSPSGRGPRHTLCRRSCFTLLELLVSLLVFSLVVGALFGVSREVSKSWSRLQEDQHELAQLMALDRTVDSILSNAVPFMWRDDEWEKAPVFVGEPERVQLAYMHRLNAEAVSEGALRFVTLFVNDDRQLIAVYQSRPFMTWDQLGDAGPPPSVLAEGVESLSFRYADWVQYGQDQELEWVDEWDPEREEIPVAILMSVVWLEGGLGTESWLRRTAGSGWRERWGKWEPAQSE